MNGLTTVEPAWAPKIAWFTEKLGPERICPMCDSPDWSVGLHAQIPIRDDQNPLVRTHYPAIALICKNCAYTALFNAVFMGVLPPQDEEG